MLTVFSVAMKAFERTSPAASVLVSEPARVMLGLLSVRVYWAVTALRLVRV